MIKKKSWTLLVALALLSSGCKDTTFKSSVPSFPVYLQLNILAEYPHFQPTNTGQYLVFKEPRFLTDAVGYGGVLIYIAMDANYHAYDLTCPHCLNPKTGVKVDGMFAVCPDCGECYDLSFGYATPTKGKSNEALRQYSAVYYAPYLTITDR